MSSKVLRRRSLKKKMPVATFNEIVNETEALLERRLAKVQELVDAESSDVNLNPFLMLMLAPAYNIFSPFEAAEHVQNAKLHQGDATAFGKFVETKILPHFGAAGPFEKKSEKSLFSPIDLETEVEGKRYLVSLKAGPRTMNKAHANEMVDKFPGIHERTGAAIIIGIVYGKRGRLNNKPKEVEAGTGDYTHTLVGREFWEFMTGVRNAHEEIFRAIKAAQARFSSKHEGQTFYEQMIQARLQLAGSIREAFKLEGEETEMWEKIFEGSF
ncbi:MAG TPA: PmeII family type II restriction endonuclease [Solirubrobacterales bacterium]|nr:PmeII family type II restriction endonuclease [Solirubrobacterales bacterium]